MIVENDKTPTQGITRDNGVCPDEMELSSYLDNRLDHEQVARLEVHFQQCGTCREALEELRALLAGGAPDDVSDEELANITQRAKDLLQS